MNKKRIRKFITEKLEVSVLYCLVDDINDKLDMLLGDDEELKEEVRSEVLEYLREEFDKA